MVFAAEQPRMCGKEQTGATVPATLIALSSITGNTVSGHLLPRTGNHARKNLAPSSVDFRPVCIARRGDAAAPRTGNSPQRGATDPGPAVRCHATALCWGGDRRPRSPIIAGFSSTGAMARRTGGADPGTTRALPMRTFADEAPPIVPLTLVCSTLRPSPPHGVGIERNRQSLSDHRTGSVNPAGLSGILGDG